MRFMSAATAARIHASHGSNGGPRGEVGAKKFPHEFIPVSIKGRMIGIVLDIA